MKIGEREMKVGYYRCPKDNPKTRKINAICHQYFGMDLICFGPEDVDIHRKKINGKVLRKGHWVEKTTSIPKIINNSPFKQRRNLEVYKFLEKNCHMMFHIIWDKEKLDYLLRKDKIYRDLLIPTKTLENFNDLMEGLEEFNAIVAKPTNSGQGRGIYSITSENQKYTIKYNDKNKVLNKNELEQFYSKYLSGKSYLIQKYINSRNSADQPFDVRVQFEKNGRGKWVRAQSYVRIGRQGHVASNISKGGSVVRWIPFLKSLYGDNWSIYAEKLQAKTKDLPKKLESLYNRNIPSIAFDFGFDNGEFYLFEANVFPGGTFARGEIAMLRAAYTRYLFKTLMGETVPTSNERQLLLEKILKERNFYKEEYEKIKQSKSWKITKPLRELLSLIKK